MPTPVSKVWGPTQDCLSVTVPGDAQAAGPELGPSPGFPTPSSVLALGCSGPLLSEGPAAEGRDLFS